jgi:cytoskeletal protein CcmA (bactofilin family)
MEVAGEVSFTQGLRVDGVLKGKIRSEARLVIGPKGRVEAEVRIRCVSINGEFRGTIHASDRVEVHKEGRVYGELFTPCLIIEAGALFEGKCNMSDQALGRQKDEAALRQKPASTQDPAAPKPGGAEKIGLK